MAIDPSIPLGANANAGGIDIASALGTANAAQQLKSNRAQLQANQVFSQAYREATDPATGQVDYGKLQALATQGGAGAFLPDFMAKITTQQNQQLEAKTKQLDLALKQQTDIRSRLGSLLTVPGVGQRDVAKDISTQLVEAAKQGTLPPEQALQYLQSVPKNPAEQQQWLKQHFLSSLDGEAKIKAMFPQTQVINTGGQQQIVNIDPMTGQPTLAGSVQNTLSPEAATSPVATVGPDGTPMAITRQQFAQQAGGGTAPQGYDGRYPGGGGGQPTQGAMPGIPGVQTGLSPAEQAAQATGAGTAAKGSAEAAQQLATMAADAPVRIGYLKDAAAALNGIQTGPGTDWRNQFMSALNSAPGLGEVLKAAGVTDPQNIKNYDEFKKIMVNYSSGVSAASGTGTDSRLNAALTGNANPQISKLANQDIITKTMAAEQYRQAQNYAFQNSGVPPQDFNKWQSQWNKAVDPAAFAFANMDAEQQAAFIDRQKKAGKLNDFKKQFVGLVKAGYIQQ